MASKFLKEQIKKLPESPGVYQFFDKKGQLLYVGKSVSIKRRVSSYFTKGSLGKKTDILVSRISKIRYIKVFSEFEALLLEAELIRANQPFFNSAARDDKSPIYIKISNTQIPLITLERKRNLKKNSDFIHSEKTKAFRPIGESVFGPFPSAKDARIILSLIRKIFPYCHHKNPEKPCLYVHLGLCPYPYESPESMASYRQVTAKIKILLSGQVGRLLKQLTEEMHSLAKNQQYEEANKVKRQISKLEHLTTVYHTPPEFFERPTLVDDLTLNRLKTLQVVLAIPKIPKRIECYDISNIQGTLAAGSMVVFTDGLPNKDQYRRFKIKFKSKPNDYEMIKEVIARRLNNNWPIPDLIIIDGGRGQLNAALSVISKHGLKIPMISLAKRFEQIYTSGRILPISLPKNNAGRALAQRIRDEAHRFAINYHRLLRSKKLLES